MLRNEVLPLEMFGLGNFEFCHITASQCTEMPPVVSSYRFRCLRTTVMALRTLIWKLCVPLRLLSAQGQLCKGTAV